MTTLREELDWIARPFSLAPPIPEEVFTECVDNLSTVIKEAGFEGGGDYQEVSEVPEAEPEKEPDNREQLAAAVQDRKDKHSGARMALKRFHEWLSGMGDHFPKAGKKLGALQKQVAVEMEKRPDKMLRAIAGWAKNKMLPQFSQRIEKTAGEYHAMKSYYDELEDIIGSAA